MVRTLRLLGLLMGITCAAIGVLHLTLGSLSVPGELVTDATVDSRERFYGAIFLGFGLAWVWAVRQVPVHINAVRWLSAIFLLGGLGRLVSLALVGPPQWFQTVLTVIELVLPVVFLLLAGAAARRTQAAPSVSV